MSLPELRRISPEDAPECVALAKRVGWTHTLEAWKQFIVWGGAGALCLTVDGQIIVTGIATRYSERLGWVGSVITDPAFQGQGMARRLMNALMEYHSGVASIMLDASELGYPVYLKLGFRALYKMEVWTATAPQVAPAASVRPFTPDDLPQVIVLDSDLNGVDRSEVISRMAYPASAWISESAGRVNGYLLVQIDSRGVHLGSWYHPKPEGARDLLQTALASCPGQPVRVQFPESNPHVRAMVEGYGLTSSRACTRMVFGDEPPGHMDDQYAIIGFATG